MNPHDHTAAELRRAGLLKTPPTKSAAQKTADIQAGSELLRYADPKIKTILTTAAGGNQATVAEFTGEAINEIRRNAGSLAQDATGRIDIPAVFNLTAQKIRTDTITKAQAAVAKPRTHEWGR